MPSDPEPWYRTPAATAAAGVTGLLIVAAIALTVVAKSDEWGRTTPAVMPVPAATTTASTAGASAPITPTTTASYTTPSVSTTEINAPPAPTEPPAPATTGAPATSEAPATTEAPPTTDDGDEPSTRTTTRRGPRTNITRTLSPP